jgi:hypothetical protein
LRLFAKALVGPYPVTKDRGAVAREIGGDALLEP